MVTMQHGQPLCTLDACGDDTVPSTDPTRARSLRCGQDNNNNKRGVDTVQQTLAP